MINEPIKIKRKYYELADQLLIALQNKNLLDESKKVIAICGESGSGKTVSSYCLQKKMEEYGVNSFLLHMDSYFKLPPATNHSKRKEDISCVGVNEININKIQSDIDNFLNNTPKLIIPIVDYINNQFQTEIFDISNTQILIIEGVYSFYLENLNFKIFLERDYHDTLEQRKERTREVYDPFVEEVLEIEHQLALAQKPLANLKIDKDFKIKKG